MFHVTWLPNHLLGNALCKWATWHKAHYYFKSTSQFDGVKYSLEHTPLRDKLKNQLIKEGYEVIPEHSFVVEGMHADLKGSIDLLAIKNNSLSFYEVKSGMSRASDKVQLMLYMWGLRRSKSRFKKLPFIGGEVIYKTSREKVSSVEVDEFFNVRVADLTQEIIAGEPDRKYPNEYECKFCKISDCDERMIVEEESFYIPTYA